LTKADYMRAKAGAVQKLKDKFARAGRKRAEQKARELLDKLNRDIENAA